MKRINKIATIFLLVCVIFTSSGCEIIKGIINLYNPPAYSQRKYVAPDEEAIAKLLEEIKTLCSESNKSSAVTAKRTSFYLKYNEAMTSRTVAYLEYYKDVNDSAAKERAEYIDAYFNQLNNSAIEMEQTILKSEYASLIIDSVGQDYADMILNRPVKSDELLELESNESALVNQYSAIYSAGSKNNPAFTDELAEIYKDLIVTRNKIAALNKDSDGNAYKNYHDYAYEQVYGRNYSPDDIAPYRQAVSQNFYEIGKALKQSSSAYITESARRSLISQYQIKQYMPEIIKATAPEMSSRWDYMMNLGLYDFNVSSSKYPNSFVIEFPQYGDGFMFIDASGSLLNDLSTIVHEFGHYNAIFATDSDKEGDVNITGIDLAETHSQCFELLTLPAVKTVLEKYDRGDVYTAYADNILLQSVWSMLSNCLFDEFEYTVYNADESALTRTYFEETFDNIWKKYWTVESDTGEPSYDYYDITHFYGSPSYCISYSASMVFASEIWASETPVADYLNVVSYGENHYLNELAEKVGLSNPFAPETLASVANFYKEQINTYLGLTIGDHNTTI